MTTSPSLSDLYSSISSNFKSEFDIQDENDLKRVLTAIASSDAGMLKIFYLALLDVQKNILPDLADNEAMGGTLERFGRLKLGRDPNPATQGRYSLTFTGVSGTTLPIGTQFVNKVTNKYYTTDASVTLSGASGTITILSDKSGLDTLQIGDTLFSVNTIININSQTTVASIVSIASNSEDLEDYRKLINQSYRLEPNGGSASDYIFWALDVPSVRTVYPYTSAPGMANIYVEGITGNGTVLQSILDLLWKSSDKTGVFEQDPDITLSDYERGRRQLGFTDLNLMSVTALPVVVTITNLKDQSSGVTTSIESEISSMLYDKRPYIAGVGDINNRNDTLYFRDVVSALDNALTNGNTYDDVSVTVNGLSIPFQFLNGNIPTLTSVVYA